MKVAIRRFEDADVPKKVEWINDPRNNAFLHYDLPLEEEKTRKWFEAAKNRTDRADYTILMDGRPVGLIGLLGIDRKNLKAEFYITMGEEDAKGCGVGLAATRLIFQEAVEVYGLQRLYLFTEVENVRAQQLFAKAGFEQEGLLRKDLVYRGRIVDRYLYGIDLEALAMDSGEHTDEA